VCSCCSYPKLARILTFRHYIVMDDDATRQAKLAILRYVAFAQAEAFKHSTAPSIIFPSPSLNFS
jgi:hypothetical protein